MINYNYYVKTRTEIVNQRKNDFTVEYEKARSKNIVVANWLDVLIEESNLIHKDAVQNGLENFRREWDNIYELDSGINLEKAFEETIAKFFPNLSVDQIGLICRIDANRELSEFIESMRIYTNHDAIDNPRPVNKFWIGTEETEFVQLIYALIEADRLNNKDKIKMTQAIADFLGFPLSNDWQSKLSHSIHQGNFDKKPRIFGDLDKAWEKYKDRQINKKLNS